MIAKVLIVVGGLMLLVSGAGEAFDSASRDYHSGLDTILWALLAAVGGALALFGFILPKE